MFITFFSQALEPRKLYTAFNENMWNTKNKDLIWYNSVNYDKILLYDKLYCVNPSLANGGKPTDWLILPQQDVWTDPNSSH